MTKASDAYAEAERRIAAARDRGANALDLSDLKALTRLPPGIGTLTALTTLVLTRTKVTDLTPLAPLTALTTLDLAHTQVTDLTPLAPLTALTTLDLWGTQVTDLKPLAPLTTLDLQGTNGTDLTPLAPLTALTTLNLSGTKVTDLKPLAPLTALTTLDLWGTKVTDLTPLAPLTALTALDLEGTNVTDLTPLAGLTELRRLDLAGTGITRDGLRALAPLQRLISDPGSKDNPPKFRGLRFAGTAAAESDPRIAEIAAIADSSTRARTLFEYLGLPVGDALPAQPDPDPLLPAVIVQGRIEIEPDPPTAAEHQDAVKQAVHPRLRDKAAGLALLARNRLPRLNRRAAALQSLLDRPFGQLELLEIHYEVEDLTDRAARGEEDGEAFGAEVDEALADIARLGPGLTRDHPAVEQHEDRLRRQRANPPPAADAATRAALSGAILAQPAAHGPNSLALERALADATDPARADALRQPKQRNMLWRLGVTAATRGETLAWGVAGSILATAYGPAITEFVTANWPLLMSAAATYGVSFAAWFVGTVGAGLFGKGAVEEWRKRSQKK